MSRELAAEKSGITANYLGEVESGEKWPSLEIICAIATALDVSLPVFFEFEAQETDPGVLIQKLHQHHGKSNHRATATGTEGFEGPPRPVTAQFILKGSRCDRDFGLHTNASPETGPNQAHGVSGVPKFFRAKLSSG